MDPTLVQSAPLGAAPLAHDLSVWGLFMQADIVVKAVMILLLMMSVWCWAIIIEKIRTMRQAQKGAAEFEETFWSGVPLDNLYDRLGSEPADPMAAVFAAGMREWRLASEKGAPKAELAVSVQQRIERAMATASVRALEKMEKSLSVLATTGSAAPFIGLFGTVWGIMNAFTAIAGAQNTSLAVVAPGIAEALFATALGLIAAIPAVIAYNKLSEDLGRYSTRLDNFASDFGAILSRAMDDAK
jgi:biopolymer transport protein TolQ